MARVRAVRKVAARRDDVRKKAAAVLPIPIEHGAIKGVKLRTVSTFTMLFAVACLLAFMAGRPPAASPSGPAATDMVRVADSRGDLSLAKNIYKTKADYGDVLSSNADIDRDFYFGLRMGSYELGLVKLR
jgi:hypothetical protein